MRIMQVILLLVCVITSCKDIQHKGSNYSIDVSDDVLNIPIPSDVYTDRVMFDVYGNEIVFKKGYDLYFYNYTTHNTRIDTFLRSNDFRIADYFRVYASYPSGLLLDDKKNMVIYNILKRKLDFIKYTKDLNQKSTQKFKISANSFGFSSRSLKNSMQSTNLRRYNPNNNSFNFYISFFDLQQLKDKIIEIDFPPDILNTIYNFEPNILFPMIEQDLGGNGVNINFKFSCKTYNIKMDGTLKEYALNSSNCDCGINNSNIEEAKSEGRLNPNILSMYGNLYPDNYRGHYYQLVNCKKYLDTEGKTTFLRILNKDYETIAESELNSLGLRGNFICLPEGLFVQSALSDVPTEEKSVTFKKIELIEN